MKLQPDPAAPGRWINPDWVPGTPGAFAVVIGISQYLHLDGSARTFGLGQLAVSAHTAGRFFHWLDADYRLDECPLASCWLLLSPTAEESATDSVLTGHAAKPTLEQCESAISTWYNEMDALPKEAANRSRSYFFFSGHGLEILQERQLLLPSDYLDPARRSKNRALSTENLTRGLAGLAVPTHFFFIDACRTDHQNLHSQEPLQGQAILDQPLNSAANPRWYAPIFHSCGSNASSFQPRSVEEGPSIFGEALLEGLQGLPDFVPIKLGGRLEVHPEPLRAFTKRRVQQILRDRYRGQYTQEVRPVLSEDCPVTSLRNEGEARLEANFAVLGDLPAFPIAANDFVLTPREMCTRPLDYPAARNLIESEFLSNIWAYHVRVFDLAQGVRLPRGDDFWITRVASRHIGRDETFQSVQLEITPVDASQHHLLTLHDGTQTFGVVLPGDLQNAQFTVEMDHDHPLQVHPNAGRPPRHLTRFEVALSAESEGELGNAAQIWEIYAAIGARTAIVHGHLGPLELTLKEKTQSPLGALIAGLILLRARAWPQLHDWLRNLAHWFETIPDGPILWNEQRLQVDRLFPADPEILAGLWALETRGLPFTAEAVSLAERQVRDALTVEQPGSGRHQRLRRLNGKFNTALRYFRPGGLFAVFAGPPGAINRGLIRFPQT